MSNVVDISDDSAQSEKGKQNHQLRVHDSGVSMFFWGFDLRERVKLRKEKVKKGTFF